MQNPYSHICLKLRCLIWCVVTWMFRSTFWEKHGWQSNGPKLNKSKPFENLAGVVGWRRLCEEALSGHAPYIFHHFPTNHNIQGISHPRNRFDRQHLVAPKHHPPLVVQHHVQHLHCYYYPLQEIDFELEHSLREWQVKQLNQNSISPKEHMLGQMHLSKLNHFFFRVVAMPPITIILGVAAASDVAAACTVMAETEGSKGTTEAEVIDGPPYLNLGCTCWIISTCKGAAKTSFSSTQSRKYLDAFIKEQGRFSRALARPWIIFLYLSSLGRRGIIPFRDDCGCITDETPQNFFGTDTFQKIFMLLSKQVSKVFQ